MGLYVEGVFRAVAHAALRLMLCALRCFALHALRFTYCMGSAFPRCAIGGEGFDNAGDEVKHGRPMVLKLISLNGGAYGCPAYGLSSSPSCKRQT